MQLANIKFALELVKTLRDQAHTIRATRQGDQMDADLISQAAEALDQELHRIPEPPKTQARYEFDYFIPARLHIDLIYRHDKLDRLVHVWQHDAEEARREVGQKQARIDQLMLEYCPNEMTPEQKEEWARNQVTTQPSQQQGVCNEGPKQIGGSETVDEHVRDNNHAGTPR